MSRAKGGRRFPAPRFAARSHRLASQTFVWCEVCGFRRGPGEAHTASSQARAHVEATGHPVRWDAFGTGIVLPSGVEPPGWPQ